MAPYDGQFNPDFGDEDEDEEQDEYQVSRDAVIFCIESSPSMISVPQEGEEDDDDKKPSKAKKRPQSNVQVALKCALEIMKRKIVVSPMDLVGIVVYNTKEMTSIEGTGKENIYFFQDLVETRALYLQKLRDVLYRADEDPAVLKKMFEPMTGTSVLTEALKMCQSLFATRAPRLSSKRVFLITDNDDPYPADGEETAQFRKAAITIAKDFSDQGYGIEPFCMDRIDHPFEYDRFFAEFLAAHVAVEEDEDEASPSATLKPAVVIQAKTKFEQLMQQLRVRESTKRSSFKIPFQIAEGVTIGVNGYGMVTEEKKRSYVWVDQNRGQTLEVVTKTEWTDVDTSAPLDPKKDIKHYFPVGGMKTGTQWNKVIFKPEEVTKLKTMGLEPGLRLLGFKPREELLFEHQVKHSYFIYPNEQTYTGSIRTFSALLKSMVKKNKFGLGLFLPRRNSAPIFVAMIPQEEERDDDDTQVKPPGIHLVSLPYLDDIRDPQVDSTIGCVPLEALESGDLDIPEIEVAKSIISKTIFKFNPDNYPNPALNHHYGILQAFALSEDDPEVDDRTLPKYKSIHDRAGPFIQKFKELVAQNPASDQMAEASTKKVSTKRRKIEPEEADGDLDAQVRKLHGKGQLSKLKVDELKSFLKAKGGSVSGKKDVLIERVEKILGGGAKGEDD